MLAHLKSQIFGNAVDYSFTPGESFLPDTDSILIGPDEEKELVHCTQVNPPPDLTLKTIMEKSQNFPLKFAVNTVRCFVLSHDDDVDANILERNINSAYPLLHENAFYLFCEFLNYKKQHGSDIEKNLYKNMTAVDLVHRLLVKRAASFFGNDRYLLLNKASGSMNWETIGTSSETAPLLLEDCLSFDELKLSALLSVTSHTLFINDGRRENRGVPCTEKDRIERHGVIVGLIGPNLTHPLLEPEEILIRKDFNIEKNGYGISDDLDNHKQKWRKIWAKFYGISPNFPTFDDRNKLSKQESGQRLLKISDFKFFDNVVYRRRLTASLESFLLEAEHRGQQAKKSVYLHVVGIGLGCWKISQHQDELFVDLFADIFKKLSPVLTHISDLHFGWINASTCGGVPDGGLFKNARIHFSFEPPHLKIKEDRLLVVSYAWNGNALPGNDFWLGVLDTTGDPAAACSSQIAEIHNPHINSKVSGNNLHIANPRWGVQHISKYADLKLRSK